MMQDDKEDSDNKQDRKGRLLSLLMVGRIYEQEQVTKLILQAAELFCERHPFTVFYFTDDRIAQKMKETDHKHQLVTYKRQKHEELIDYIVTFGGDGTILYGAKFFQGKTPPVISFMRGTLGFMCRFHHQNMRQVIVPLVEYHQGQIEMPFKTSSVMRLETTIGTTNNNQTHKEVRTSINEVYVSRKTHQRIILSLYIDGECLTKTAGDGLLISTPTGSTAYSLSAGGPILSNGVDSMLIVPIAPNSLSFRPICLAPDTILSIRLHKTSRSEALLSFDGQAFEELTFDKEITIRRSPNPLTCTKKQIQFYSLERI